MKPKILRKIFLLSCILFSLLFASFLGCTSETEKNYSESVALFNGKNLDGWYTYIKGRGRNIDPLGVFSVKDGMIRISGEEWGCITSNKDFENYRIIIEFKWGEKTWGKRSKKARDSGLLLHSVGKNGAFDGAWKYSIEANIIEGGVGDLIVVGCNSEYYALTALSVPSGEKRTGLRFDPKQGVPSRITEGRIDWFGRDPLWKDVLNFRGKNDVESPFGEWTKMECVCLNDKIDVYVNGVLVNSAYNVSPRIGKIQVQSEGAEIFIRRVDIIPIKQTRSRSSNSF